MQNIQMDRVSKKTQLSEHNRRFHQQMDLVNASENATAANGKTKKRTTGRKGEWMKEERSTGSRVKDSHKGDTS